MCAFFVDTHQSRIADNIREQDGFQLTFQVYAFHADHLIFVDSPKFTKIFYICHLQMMPGTILGGCVAYEIALHCRTSSSAFRAPAVGWQDPPAAMAAPEANSARTPITKAFMRVLPPR
jgi:hypothetical protein